MNVQGLARGLATGVVVAAGVAAVAAVGIADQLDPPVLAERARARIAAELGRPVHARRATVVIRGARPVVVLDGVAIARPPGRAAPALVSADVLEIALARWPLLWGEARIARIVVHAPHVIAGGTLAGIAAWRPPIAAAFEIENGRAEIDVRVGDSNHRVTFDQFSARRAAGGPIALTARGAADRIAFALDGRVEPDESGLRIDAERLQAGGSELAGVVRLEPRCDRPRVSADLAASRFVVDDWLDASFMPDIGLAGLLAMPESAGAPGFLDGLRVVDLAIDLSAADAAWAGHDFSDLQLSLSLADGRLEIAGLRARAGEGWFKLSGLVDRYDAEQALAVKSQGLALSAFQRAEAGRARVDLDIAVHATGRDWAAVMASITGRARIALFDADIAAGQHPLLDAVMPWVPAGGRLPVDRLEADLALDAGVLDWRAVRVETPQVSLAVAGVIDLPQRTVQLALTPTAKDPAVADLAVPLIISGVLDQPAVLPGPSRRASPPSPSGEDAGKAASEAR